MFKMEINQPINHLEKTHFACITEASCHIFLQFRKPVFACLGHFQIIWLADTFLGLFVKKPGI